VNDANLAGPDSDPGGPAFRCVRPRPEHGSKIATVSPNCAATRTEWFGPARAIQPRSCDSRPYFTMIWQTRSRSSGSFAARTALVASAECEKRPLRRLSSLVSRKMAENDEPARTIELDEANADVNSTERPSPLRILSCMLCDSRPESPARRFWRSADLHHQEKGERFRTKMPGARTEFPKENGAPRVRFQDDTCLVIYNQNASLAESKRRRYFSSEAATLLSRCRESPYA